MPPKKPYTNSKTSDRRLASGARPTAFLKSQQERLVAKTKGINNSKNTGSKETKFKLFVGNLGPDLSEDLLRRSFAQYASLCLIEVPKNPRGFGFVGFEDPKDFLRAFKEMQGKYVGQHPCTIKRANGGGGSS